MKKLKTVHLKMIIPQYLNKRYILKNKLETLIKPAFLKYPNDLTTLLVAFMLKTISKFVVVVRNLTSRYVY